MQIFPVSVGGRFRLFLLSFSETLREKFLHGRRIFTLFLKFSFSKSVLLHLQNEIAKTSVLMIAVTMLTFLLDN